MKLLTGIPLLLFLFNLQASSHEGTTDVADLALTGLRDVKYQHFLKVSRSITYGSSRTKRSAIFSTGVKVCPQETAKAVISSHRAYYKLRVCQEAIWEAFHIFFDRVPNSEEYMGWVYVCQHENLCMDDLARNFSSSPEHLDLVARRVAELGESEGTPEPEPGRDCPFTPQHKDVPTEPAEVIDEHNQIPEKPQQYVVEFSVTVVDPIYSGLLQDPSAPQYADVIRELRDEMYHAFEKIPGFKEIRVLGFRAEDVSVRYAVVFNGDTELSDQPDGYHMTDWETQEMTALKLKNIIVQALKRELSLPLDLNTLSFNDVFELDENGKLAYTVAPPIEGSSVTAAAVEDHEVIRTEPTHTPTRPAEAAGTQVEHTSITEEETDAELAMTGTEAVVSDAPTQTEAQATVPTALEVTVQQPMDPALGTLAPAEEGTTTGTGPDSSQPEWDGGQPFESSPTEGDTGQPSDRTALTEEDTGQPSERTVSTQKEEDSQTPGHNGPPSDATLTDGDDGPPPDGGLTEEDGGQPPDTTLTEGDNERPSDATLTEGGGGQSSDTTVTEGDGGQSSDTTVTEGDSGPLPDGGLTEGDSGPLPDGGLTEGDSGPLPDGGLTEGDSGPLPDGGLTEGDSGPLPDGGLTEGDSGPLPDGGLTEGDSGPLPDGGLTEGDSGPLPDGGLTEGDSGPLPDGGLTEGDSGPLPDGGLTEGDSGPLPDGGLTEWDSGPSPDGGLTEGDSGPLPDGGLTEGGSGPLPDGGLTEEDSGPLPDGGLTEGDSGPLPDGGLTEGGSGPLPDGGLTEGDSGPLPDGGLTEGESGPLPDGGLTEGDSGPLPDGGLTDGDSGPLPDGGLTEGDSGPLPDGGLTEGDSGPLPDGGLTEGDSGPLPDGGLTEEESGSGLSSEVDSIYEVTSVPAMRLASTPLMAAVDKSRDLVVLFSLRVTNMMFTDSLINKDSPEYKSLENTFLELLLPYLETNLTGFKALEILSFQNGSVIVNSRMKLNKAVPYNVTEAVQCVLEEFCNTASNQLEIQVDSRSLEVEQADEPDPCKSMTCSEFSRCVVNGWSGEAECMCDPGYSAADGQLCQSVCTLEPDFCLNGGLCQNIPGHGATCRCPVGKYWHYHGERCDELVTLPMDTSSILTGLVGSVCLVAAVIGILIFINKKCIQPQKAVTVVHTLAPYAFDTTLLENPVFQNDGEEFITQVSTLPYPPSSVSSQSQPSEHEHFASIENIHLSIEIPRQLYTTRSEKLVSDTDDFHYCIPHTQTWRAPNQRRTCCLLRASENDCLEVTMV